MNRPSPTTYTLTNAAGFTLVEVLVSLALFMVVVTISVGSMMVLIDANAKTRNIQTLINNVSFTLDSMTREIRQGYDYTCPNNDNYSENSDNPLNGRLDLEEEVSGGPGRSGEVTPRDCYNGKKAFAYTETDSSLTAACDTSGLVRRVGYRLGTHENENGSIERSICGSDWSPVTPQEVNITKLLFFAEQTTNTASDNGSPRVMIVIEGTAGEYDTIDSSFAIQTTVTQRSLDL